MADMDGIGGRWRNDAGSELEIVERDGRLEGAYRTAVGRADTARSYGLTGWRAGRAFGFVVSWAPDSDSVTAWSGVVEGAGAASSLHTVWTLARARAYGKAADGTLVERPAAPWEAFGVQASVFRRA